MKRYSLFLVAALAGCSPTRPSAMDVQIAVERFFFAHAVGAQGNHDIVIGCPPISEMANDDSDGELAHVRFGFDTAGGRGNRGSRIYTVALIQGGQGWHIPFEAKLDKLPCEAAKVREIPRS